MNKKINIPGFAGSVLLFICIFLPFVKASGYGTSVSATLMDGNDGKLFLIVAVLGLIFSVMNKPVLITIAGGVACLFSYIEIQSFEDNAVLGVTLDKGIGFWIMLLGAIVLLVGGIIGTINNKKQK